MKFKIENDGVDHINVYSKGQTEIGKLLSNFSHFPFNCEDGHFESIEGYWYWLSTKDDRLTPFKTTIQNIGLNTQFEIPPFPSSELEMIKNSMSIHYDNVWICINAPYDVIGCIGFNEKTR